MATAKEQQMKIKAKLEAVRKQIDELRIQEKLLIELLGDDAPAKPVRQRSPSIKPLVLDYMKAAGESGATTAEVDAAIRAQVPTVAKDTVGSILSRLKGDGALVYEGERYYEKKFAPRPNPFSDVGGLRAVS
ncbi:hypothetical protein JI743_13580 [Sphingopyxis sp. DHUNG17]|uniref:hypothetical protein n=1 Tax=Sphingopyxis jiangsuensis TaxID=2871171 RepID=UPI00191FEE99|nr:hypothetical protein [Sphingopyxis lutea]MBL0769836.1 hypothetical protein [Sphingopyxis lutea]